MLETEVMQSLAISPYAHSLCDACRLKRQPVLGSASGHRGRNLGIWALPLRCVLLATRIPYVHDTLQRVRSAWLCRCWRQCLAGRLPAAAEGLHRMRHFSGWDGVFSHICTGLLQSDVILPRALLRQASLHRRAGWHPHLPEEDTGASGER